MITTNGISMIGEKISGLFSSGKAVIDGVVINVKINSKTIVGNTIIVRLLFDENNVGNITKFELINNDGVVVAEQPDNITKVKDKMLLVTFSFKITEVI